MNKTINAESTSITANPCFATEQCFDLSSLLSAAPLASSLVLTCRDLRSKMFSKL